MTDPRNAAAPGTGGTGGNENDQGRSDSIVIQTGDKAAEARRSGTSNYAPATRAITCRYANVTGAVGACGAFTADHHQQAAARGLCCVAYAFQTAEIAAALPTAAVVACYVEEAEHPGPQSSTKNSQTPGDFAALGIDQAAPDAPDWPPFDPCDNDVPGVAW